MTNNTLLDYAEKYLNLGFEVIPLHYPTKRQNGFVCSCGATNCNSPAKHPVGILVASGSKSGTSDFNLVRQWFGNRAWNLGIVTGRRSNLIVLDVDPRDGGEESLAILEKEHGSLPPTIRFLTGGGGQHILFRHPGGIVPNSASKIGNGLDIRGEGGFVVAPPSQHISGRTYAISVDHHPDDCALANPPSWLARVANYSGGRIAVSDDEWRKRTGSPIPEGMRNDSLARIAGHLLAHRINLHVCLDLILSVNATRCDPPLSEQEVTVIVASIARREIAKRTWCAFKEARRD